MSCHEVNIASVCSSRFSQFSCSNFLDCEQSKHIDIYSTSKKTYEEAHVDKNPWWYSKGIATWLRRNRVTLDDVGHRIVAAARDVNRRFHPARAMFVTTNPTCTIIHRSHQPFTFLVVTSHESHGTFHLVLHPVSLHCFFTILFWCVFLLWSPDELMDPGATEPDTMDAGGGTAARGRSLRSPGQSR